MYYVYILQFEDKSFYIGYSTDLRQRLKSHWKKEVSSTKWRKNPHLVFYAAFSSEIMAIRFEKYLKSSSGFAFRNKRFI